MTSMEDPRLPLSHSRSLPFRPSRFIQKLSHFRASLTRRSLKNSDQRSRITPYNTRTTRSEDIHAKHYMSQPTLVAFPSEISNIVSSDRDTPGSPSSSHGAVPMSHTRSMPPSTRQPLPTQLITPTPQARKLIIPPSQTVLGLACSPDGHVSNDSAEEFVVIERPKPPEPSQISERPELPDIRVQTASPVSSQTYLTQPPIDATSPQPPEGQGLPTSAPSERPSRSSTLPLPLSTASTARRNTPHLNGLPPTQRFSIGGFTDSERGRARLSPFIVARHHPMPIKNLPTLRPHTAPDAPKEALSKTRSAARLRQMPSLPMKGSTDEPTGAAGDNDDHELTIDDEDEDEDEMFEDAREGLASDDEDGDVPRASTSSTITSHSDSLPTIDTSRLDVPLNGGEENVSSTSPKGKGKAREDADRTPTLSRPVIDYFSSGLRPESSSSSRPLSPAETSRLASQTPLPFPHELDILKATLPRSHPPRRPNIYHHASKSMVTLMTPTRLDDQSLNSTIHIKDCLQDGGLKRIPSPRTDTYEDAHETLAERQKKLSIVPPYDGIEHPLLRRRQSMPTFHAGSPPPPYPNFPRFQKTFIHPREDEGREKLPSYSNDIYLRAIMPRKMEFIGPGVQAKDRKWRRVICELEGTVFRVYKCPASISGVGAISEWWENKVGVGDVSTSSANTTPKEKEAQKAKNLALGRAAKLDEEARSLEAAQAFAVRRSVDALSQASSSQASPSISSSRTPLATDHDHVQESNRSKLKNLLKSGRPHGRSVSEIANPPQPRGSPRPSLNIPREPRTSISSSSRPPSLQPPRERPSWTNRSQAMSSSPNLPDPESLELIRAYTLQNAESGLGNDYVKRKCVIRLRMEGEQFLLQGKDIPEVIEWIEGFQAAANVALDLDSRQMPKGPLFPRRRRRRVPRPGNQNGTSGS